MENQRSIPARTRWDEVHNTNTGRGMARIREERSGRTQTVALYVVAAILHGCIGYFGWRWISSMQTPSPAIATVSRVEPTQKTVPAPKARPRINPTKSSIAPVIPRKILCVAGIPYTTRTGNDGSMVIEVITIGGKPATCQNNG